MKAFALEQIGAGVKNVSVDVVIGKDNDTVQVVVKEEWSLLFAHYLGTDVTPIVAKATAKLAGKTNLCVLALDSNGENALRMDKTAKLKATGCAVYANSANSQAIRLDADSEIEASLVCAAGGIKAKSTAINPTPTTDCPVLQDPLAGRSPPHDKPCAQTNLDLVSSAHTLQPGKYCRGLKISKNAIVTFEPGEYIIADGDFEVRDDASISGENVAFYLKGELSVINFSDNTTVSLSGAATGSMAGLLFFEDRSTTKGRLHKIKSANAHTLTGTIYLPNGKLRVDPNTSVAQNSAYTAIISYQVEIDEGATLVLNDDYGDTDVPVPEGIQTSSQVVLVQ